MKRSLPIVLVVVGGLAVLAFVKFQGQSAADGEGEIEAEAAKRSAYSERGAEPSWESQGRTRPAAESFEMGVEAGGFKGFGQGGEEQIANRADKLVLEGNQKRARRLIDRLTADLDLSLVQQAQLQERFDVFAEEAGAFDSGEAAAEARLALAGDGLEDEMAEILTDEQLEAFKGLEKKRDLRIVDSAALGKLSGLNGAVDLREGQREALYDYFYNQATEARAAQREAIENGTAARSGLGNLPGLDRGLLGQIDLGAVASSAEESGLPFQEAFEAERNAVIDRQVEALAPILDDDQLGRYRDSLQDGGEAGPRIMSLDS